MPSPPADLGARRAAFRALHESGCFVIPNPWDVGTAKALAAAGFAALATTSGGFAFSRGVPDEADALSVDDVLGHIGEIVAATELPVNADFQAGYADDADGVATNVGRCVTEAGVAGLSIEDARPDRSGRLYEIHEATDRVAAARAAIDASGADVLLTGRAECFLTNHPEPLEEAIRRLGAYAEAGADVLYAPGIRDPEQMHAIVETCAPKPVNVLIGSDLGLRVGDLAEASASAGSASAQPSRGSPGGPSGARSKLSPRTAASPPSTAPHPSPSSTSSSPGTSPRSSGTAAAPARRPGRRVASRARRVEPRDSSASAVEQPLGGVGR